MNADDDVLGEVDVRDHRGRDLTLRTHCPNCGQRLTLHETAEEYVQGKPGCGDCAQAGVRPRLLYRLVLLRDDEE